MIAYRYLTEVDDAVFCHKVTQALSNGWTLYGSPSLAFDAESGKMRCGQAVTKEVPETDYSPDTKLGSL